MPRRMLGYALTVFLRSALLLVLEIVAGRLLAPYASLPVLTDDLVPVERLMASLFLGKLGR